MKVEFELPDTDRDIIGFFEQPLSVSHEDFYNYISDATDTVVPANREESLKLALYALQDYVWGVSCINPLLVAVCQAMEIDFSPEGLNRQAQKMKALYEKVSGVPYVD